MKIYRAMKADADGKPVVGPTARTLGVRPGDQAPHNDIEATSPGDTVLPGSGGMSASPNDPANLPKNRRPAELGGTGKDPVWEIDAADLGEGLAFRQDKPTHGTVEAAEEMTKEEYDQLLTASRDKWRRVVG